MNALGELTAEGWIVAKEKMYYQVVATLPNTFLQPAAAVKRSVKRKELQWQMGRPLKIADYVSPLLYRVSFPSGFLMRDFFPCRSLSLISTMR